MTRGEFIEILEKKGYSYKIEGDKIVVTRGNRYGDVFLGYIKITSIPPGVEFRNKGNVELSFLESIPNGVVFNNGDDVSLTRLKSLPPGVVFNNGGRVIMISLIVGGLNGLFSRWSGNIEGIDFKRLLNVMIKQGVFI